MIQFLSATFPFQGLTPLALGAEMACWIMARCIGEPQGPVSETILPTEKLCVAQMVEGEEAKEESC